MSTRWMVSYVVVNIPCLVCLGISGFLAWHGLMGWGWFLFVAALLHQGMKSKDAKDEP